MASQSSEFECVEDIQRQSQPGHGGEGDMLVGQPGSSQTIDLVPQPGSSKTIDLERHLGSNQTIDLVGQPGSSKTIDLVGQPGSSKTIDLVQLDRVIQTVRQEENNLEGGGMRGRDRYGRFSQKPGNGSKQVRSEDQKMKDKIAANVSKMKTKAVKLLERIQNEMCV